MSISSEFIKIPLGIFRAVPLVSKDSRKLIDRRPFGFFRPFMVELHNLDPKCFNVLKVFDTTSSKSECDTMRLARFYFP